MPTREHLVLCGGVEGPKGGGRATVRLDLHGPLANVKLSISDIARKLLVNIPDRLVDLLEIATYVYAADGAISRGGKTDSEMGARWRRTLRFKIPVREPALWGSEPVSAALIETLSFLSDEQYAFDFEPFHSPPSLAGSLLVLKVSGLERAQTVPEPSPPELSLPAVREVRLAADSGTGWIIFERWGPIKGAGAKLLSTLLAEFDQAAEEKLAPEHYRFVSSRVLASRLACDSDETLRRQVLRLRNDIRRLAKSAGESAPPDDAVIENQQGRGYRLNPDSIRVVAVTELRRR